MNNIPREKVRKVARSPILFGGNLKNHEFGGESGNRLKEGMISKGGIEKK